MNFRILIVKTFCLMAIVLPLHPNPTLVPATDILKGLNWSIRSGLILLCECIKNFEMNSPFKEPIGITKASHDFFDTLQKKIISCSPPQIIKIFLDFDPSNKTHVKMAIGCSMACITTYVLIWHYKEYFKQLGHRQLAKELKRNTAATQEKTKIKQQLLEKQQQQPHLQIIHNC